MSNDSCLLPLVIYLQYFKIVEPLESLIRDRLKVILIE